MGDGGSEGIVKIWGWLRDMVGGTVCVRETERQGDRDRQREGERQTERGEEMGRERGLWGH